MLSAAAAAVVLAPLCWEVVSTALALLCWEAVSAAPALLCWVVSAAAILALALLCWVVVGAAAAATWQSCVLLPPCLQLLLQAWPWHSCGG